MSNFLDSLSKVAWETSCARYNASRRLKVREIFSTISIALIGLSGICISLIQFYFSDGIEVKFNQLITTFSIALSMLLIVISLIEWGVGAGAKSEALFRNAELLNEHERKIKLFNCRINGSISKNDYEIINSLRDEYEKIKSACTFNHSPIDYEYHKIQKSRYYISTTFESFGLLRNIKGRVNYHICSIWAYLLVWLIVLVFFLKLGIVLLLP